MGAFASGSLIGPGTLPMADHFKTWGVTATLAALERAKEVTAKREATLRQVSTAQSLCWASSTPTPTPQGAHTHTLHPRRQLRQQSGVRQRQSKSEHSSSAWLKKSMLASSKCCAAALLALWRLAHM